MRYRSLPASCATAEKLYFPHDDRAAYAGIVPNGRSYTIVFQCWNTFHISRKVLEVDGLRETLRRGLVDSARPSGRYGADF